jgi:hypothetical protein
MDKTDRGTSDCTSNAEQESGEDNWDSDETFGGRFIARAKRNEHASPEHVRASHQPDAR